MKQTIKTSRTAGYLEKIFRALNEHYFDGAIEEPVITIQSTPRAYGHVTVAKAWQRADGGTRHELNIGAGTLDRPIENVIATVLHEMVHLFNLQIGVQDTSRGGTYHNKKFRDAAQARDLHISYPFYAGAERCRCDFVNAGMRFTLESKKTKGGPWLRSALRFANAPVDFSGGLSSFRSISGSSQAVGHAVPAKWQRLQYHPQQKQPPIMISGTAFQKASSNALTSSALARPSEKAVAEPAAAPIRWAAE